MLFPLIFTSCLNTTWLTNPHLDFSVQDKYIRSLPLSFAPLSDEELKEPWGHETRIGHLFAEELDLYAAITALKRARLLLPQGNLPRKAEIDYGILYCYYLGKKYTEVVDTFENSSLAQVNTSFPAFHDLLVILAEAYEKTKDSERAAWILQTLATFYPDNGKKMAFTLAYTKGDLEALKQLASDTTSQEELTALQIKKEEDPLFREEITTVQHNEKSPISTADLEEYISLQTSAKKILLDFHSEKKNPFTASCLNALVPGAGYLYLGQKQSAFTAFCLNSLFIGAAYYFYQEKNIPAAVITTGFEMGWYFGGIVGVKEAALFYNERLYESKVHPAMRSSKLYPLLQLNYGF